MATSNLQSALASHLAWWGISRFESDEAYFRWQRETLSASELTELNRLAEQKRDGGASAEIAFYDRTAHPHMLPVLYSQRYDYYMHVGIAVAERIAQQSATFQAAGPAASLKASVLDFGCGIGILTTFYARQFPDFVFVGIDRSEASLTAARQRAEVLKLANVRFQSCDVQQAVSGGPYDVILSTHTLLQAEQDPGIPSRGWRTFDRDRDPDAQAAFETRTGLGVRLDHLCTALAPDGRLVVFEKTRLLARRVPFQRALAARGLRLCEPPVPIRYQVVEEVSDDGPLYVLAPSRGQAGSAGSVESADSGPCNWDEAPEQMEEEGLYRCRGGSATFVRERLPDRAVTREAHVVQPQLGQIRAEWGTSDGLFSYLYVTAGERLCGILVGGRPGETMLDCRVGRVILGGGQKPVEKTLVAMLEETWPPASESDDEAQTPLYENHSPYAQAAWSNLPDRSVLKNVTQEEPGWLQRHVELGVVAGGKLTYLYQATNFDQRQLVVVEQARKSLLEDYYQELVGGTPPAVSR